MYPKFYSLGFKSEWAAVKDEKLYVGSTGKEKMNADGKIIDNNQQWIKIISPQGEVRSENWVSNYARLRKAINSEFPGMS